MRNIRHIHIAVVVYVADQQTRGEFERADIAPGQPRAVTLVGDHGRAGVVDAAGGVAGVERRGAGGKGVGLRTTAVAGQGSQIGVDPGDVAGRVAADGAAGRVLDQVVAIGGEATRAIGEDRAAGRPVDILADEAVAHDRRGGVGEPAAIAEVVAIGIGCIEGYGNAAEL